MGDLEERVLVTQEAADHIKELAEANDLSLEDYELRLGVQGGGCSGYMYTMNFQELQQARDTDTVYDTYDISIMIDYKSMLFLKGTILDYESVDLMRAGFTFTNPNATRSCGCGQSFQ